MRLSLLLLGFIATSSPAAMEVPKAGWDCAVTQVSICRQGVCSPIKASGKVHYDGVLYSVCEPADRCTTVAAHSFGGEDFRIIPSKDKWIAEVRGDMSFFEMREQPAGLRVTHGRCHEAAAGRQPAPRP